MWSFGYCHHLWIGPKWSKQSIIYNFQGIVHVVKFDKFYHLSWLETGLNTTFNWDEARNYCRRFCMDAISFESFDEVLEFNSIIESGQILQRLNQGFRYNQEPIL